jgi:hypothetical protein
MLFARRLSRPRDWTAGLPDGVAVLPVEWWDPKWIKDNVQPKLEGMSGEAIAEMQQPRKTAPKRRR